MKKIFSIVGGIVAGLAVVSGLWAALLTFVNNNYSNSTELGNAGVAFSLAIALVMRLPKWIAAIWVGYRFYKYSMRRMARNTIGNLNIEK